MNNKKINKERKIVKLRKLITSLVICVLFLQFLLTTVGVVYAETTDEASFMNDINEVEASKALNQEDELNEKAESEPSFFFTESNITATVGELVEISFHSNLEISEARVTIPKEAKLVEDKLPTGLSVTQGVQEKWIMRTESAQDRFILPVVFEEEGKYDIYVEKEKVVIEILPAVESEAEGEPETDDNENPQYEDNQEDQESEERKDQEQEDRENKTDTSKNKIVEGTWGSVPWTYDEQTETITLYGGEAGIVGDAPWKTHQGVREIKVVEKVILPESCNLLFAGLRNLTQMIGSKLFDTSNTLNMSRMFLNTNNLTKLDVSNWDVSNVTDMSHMFSRAENLTKLDVSNWDVSKVTTMRFIFSDTKKLSELDVSNWDVSNVTDMDYMFARAENLSKLDVSNWDVSNVTDMWYTFYSTKKLGELDVSNWNVSNVTGMSHMFARAENLTELDVSNWDVSKVTTMRSAFSDTKKLSELDISNWDVSNVWNMNNMFAGAENLTKLDVSNWDVSKVTNMRSAFSDTKKLSELDVSNWDVSNVWNMNNMFARAENLTELDVSNWDVSNVTNMNNMFADTGLRSIKLGEKSIFNGFVNLPPIEQTNEYTGRWVLEESLNSDSRITFANSFVFMNNYDGSHPGTYIWEKNQISSVEIKYLDDKGKELAPSEVIEGFVGEEYTTEAKDIEHYRVTEKPENASGVFTEDPIEVNYIYDVVSVPIYDPLKPENEIDPENKPDIPEDQGLLSIDFVSQFNFGSQPISTQEKFYYVLPQRLLNADGSVIENEERPNYVQISDRRADSERKGWKLSVRKNDQFKGGKENQELRGAKLILKNQQLATAQGKNAPELYNSDQAYLEPGAKRTLLTAKEDQGKGTWIYRFGDQESADKSIALKVPAGANPEATTYSTTLTWELSSVPDPIDGLN